MGYALCMKWTTPNPLLQSMHFHPSIARKYKLEKRSHRYALLQNTKGLEALIEHNPKRAWVLIDALVADVLERAAFLSQSTPDRIKLGLHIGGQEMQAMDQETVGIEALWTLPLRMRVDVFEKRPFLPAANRQFAAWFRGFHLKKLQDVEYGPLLAVAWMTPQQRQELMALLVINEAKKDTDIRDPQKMMGAEYLLGCEPSDWDEHDYLAASHGIQRWLERLFFQVSPHQCTWIRHLNPLLGEWFPDYWNSARDHQSHENVRQNTLAALETMTFAVDEWYSWWSWHALVASPTARNSKAQWATTVPVMNQNGLYRGVRQPLSRPQGAQSIDLDIVQRMQSKHPAMAHAYTQWASIAAATLGPGTGDVKWVQRMWDMYNASLRGSVQESLSVEGLLFQGQ